MTPCPDGHVVYLSEMLADNAVTLHQMLHFDDDGPCTGIGKFKHGDHWHIGHGTGTKDRCPPAKKQQRFNPIV